MSAGGTRPAGTPHSNNEWIEARDSWVVDDQSASAGLIEEESVAGGVTPAYNGRPISELDTVCSKEKRRVRVLFLNIVLLVTIAANADWTILRSASQDIGKSPRSQPAAGNPPTSRPARPEGSQPEAIATHEQSDAEKIRRLIHRLGDRVYRVREQAQTALARLGPAALPYLVEFIDSRDPEIANRVVSLIKRPEDAALRMVVVVRLLSTGDPDLMEPGVHMLFEEPLIDYGLFVASTKNAKGLQRAIFEPIAAQLAEWKQATELHLARRVNLLRDQRISVAADELKQHRGTRLYQAEAAYWQAVDAVEEYAVKQGQPRITTTRPSEGDGEQ